MKLSLSKSVGNYIRQNNLIFRGLSVVAAVLLVVVLAVPGVLHLLYRADAQTVLGNAKMVRLALQTTGTECYGMDTVFGDAKQEGGVSESVYQDVLMLSKAPGDFWVLQLGENGYTVEKFLYREGDYAVYYSENPTQYEVYREKNFIRTRIKSEE